MIKHDFAENQMGQRSIVEFHYNWLLLKKKKTKIYFKLDRWQNVSQYLILIILVHQFY